MTTASGDVESELAGLSFRYAEGCDRRSAELFVGAFTADGVLEVVPVDGPPSTLAGREALATVPERLRRWSATIHHVQESRYELTGPTTATGEVRCRAHHVTHTIGGTEDRVMDIRYVDTYACEDGHWRIARRRVEVDSVTEGPFRG